MIYILCLHLSFFGGSAGRGAIQIVQHRKLRKSMASSRSVTHQTIGGFCPCKNVANCLHVGRWVSWRPPECSSMRLKTGAHIFIDDQSDVILADVIRTLNSFPGWHLANEMVSLRMACMTSFGMTMDAWVGIENFRLSALTYGRLSNQWFAHELPCYDFYSL